MRKVWHLVNMIAKRCGAFYIFYFVEVLFQVYLSTFENSSVCNLGNIHVTVIKVLL